MIKSFTVTNFLGDSIRIDMAEPEKSGFAISSVTGLGPAKANITISEISTNDGALFNSSRLNSRNIVFNLLFFDTDSGETIEEIRLKSYRFFPPKKKITLLVETDKRTAEIVGYVETNEPTIFSKNEGAQISIICPDPYFYSAGEYGTMRTVFSGDDPMFEFPFSNESMTEKLLVFGEVQLKTSNVVYYPGDAETVIIIKLHAIGPIEGISIYNTKTKEVMKLDTSKLEAIIGSSIQNGDDIIINTKRGEKSVTFVRKGEKTNILNCLDRNSDWLYLVKGDNVFAFAAEKNIENLQVVIENKVLFEGV